MIKHCRRCGDKLSDNRTNQRYCPHCADLTEFERREQRLKLSPKRKRALLKTQRAIEMFVQPPLKIDCDGLSQKLIFELADRLRLHFVDVDVFGDEISASKPLNFYHYAEGWEILDAFGVKVT